jgi:hemolysin activation/secretion protein
MLHKKWIALVCAAFVLTPVRAQAQAAPTLESAPLINIQRFVIEGDNPLGEARAQALLARHLGPHNDLASIEAAATTLERALRDEGLAFHRVIVPAQRPESGELKLRILRFTLADIGVSGNRHFSRENILRSLPSFKAGTSPDVQALGRDLTLANEHPAKRLTVQFKESTKPDAISADVIVRDVPTAQTFVGLTGHTRDFENSLNRNTGYTRLTIGHQRSNLFDLDHALTVAYTTSPDHLDKVSQWGVFYWAPLYGYSTSINAYWTKSDVDTGTVGVGGVNFNVSGRGEFYGLRATHALPKWGSISHSVSLAVDSRYFQNSVGFVGGALPTTAVGSMPLTARYAAKTEQTWGALGGAVEYVANLGGGRGNDTVSYLTARPLASTNWRVIRWEVEALYNLGGRWTLGAKARGQQSDHSLIPGEQFGVGGVSSVRGLKEREVTGDRGYTANIELTAPPMVAGITPFAFADFGRRTHVTTIAATNPRDNVASTGLGARWNWEKGLDVMLSYAHVLNGTGTGLPGTNGTPRGHDKVNFSLFYRF